jgi:hypothetical protein
MEQPKGNVHRKSTMLLHDARIHLKEPKSNDKKKVEEWQFIANLRKINCQ